MKISLNEIYKLVPAARALPASELVSLIGSRLVEVEGVDDWSKKYKNIFVAKVLSATPIEGTHLHLCQIDAGAHTSDFDPEHDGFVQVVCGAPNVHAGMLAVWIAPGAIVPATFGTADEFEISARKLRGHTSYGMLCAADELALGDNHEGILELDPQSAHPGDNFADVFDLNDQILDIENKSLTHRPDCFGLIGFAREVSGILGEEFSTPDFMSHSLPLDASGKGIEISSPELCPCYSYAVIDLENPLEKNPYFDATAVFLAKAGMRPISKIVDATNYYMLLTGQPLHAFDYDKFIQVGATSEPKIGVRLARPDEKLTLLDGTEVALVKDDILITSGDIPVALAGAMGGKSTEIDATTKKVVLESATFSLYHLRKTQMAHGIFSEAITRFTKGQPASACVSVLSACASSLGGKILSLSAKFAVPTEKNVVKITTTAINSLLGSDYSKELIIRTLRNTNFEVSATKGDELEVTAPSWRTDIHIKEDIIEEVGRLLGYDNLPLSFPTRPFVEAEIEPLFRLKSSLRHLLSDKYRASEALTYSFVSEDLLTKVGEDPENSYKIINSISPELQRFRQSLTPSLLDHLRENLKVGFSDFSLYEINQVAPRSLGLTDENVPRLETHLSLITLGDYYSAKFLLTGLLRSLGLDFRFETFDGSLHYFEPTRSVTILASDGARLGSLGELRTSVLKQFKLTAPISAFELNLDALLLAQSSASLAKSSPRLSRFPFVSRDLTFSLAKTIPYSDLEAKILSALAGEGLIYTLSPVSIYAKDTSSAAHNLSFRLRFSSPEKTLTSAEISAIIEKITASAGELGAKLI